MIDRVIISFMITPIKQSFQVSDAALAVLAGIAFTLFYTVIGLPIGRLADHYSRRWIVVAGITLWSLATIVCGFVRSYEELFFSRIVVGVGEATLGPAAYSLIADYFPDRKRTLAFSIYSMGITIGTGLATLIAGTVVSLAAESWQQVFVIVGAPGLLVAMIAMTIVEPQRQQLDIQVDLKTSWRNGIKPVWRLVVCFTVGFGLFSIFNQGVGFWLPEMIVRAFGWSKAHIGQVQGASIAFGGTLGLICGARLTAWFEHRGAASASLLTMSVCAAGLLLSATVMIICSLFDQSGIMTVWMFVPVMLFGFAPYGAATSGLQRIVPPYLRGQMGALFLFTINLIGGGIGPILVAVLQEAISVLLHSIALAIPSKGVSFLMHYAYSLRHAMVIATVAGVGSALGVYWWGVRWAGRNMQQYKTTMQK
jgi:MFS family permease